MVTEGPAFTGMRHFLFVVPALAVLCGVGFDALLRVLRPWRWASSAARGVTQITQKALGRAF
jgi:hypothetical protein